MTISIHVPLAGDDGPCVGVSQSGGYFYPRPPCGGRHSLPRPRHRVRHFYPRPPCGGRRGGIKTAAGRDRISIHVPLAGDDSSRQSATATPTYFYPRPPCGGRQIRKSAYNARKKISIHVPLAGDDSSSSLSSTTVSYFYPRPPCGGRRARRTVRSGHPDISIHVPLAGDDRAGQAIRTWWSYFYPRPPCGGRRRVFGGRGPWGGEFLSTSPLRGTTSGPCVMPVCMRISIHVPLAGDDQGRHSAAADQRHFYPRPPCGGRPRSVPHLQKALQDFYPRPPCGGRR